MQRCQPLKELKKDQVEGAAELVHWTKQTSAFPCLGRIGFSTPHLACIYGVHVEVRSQRSSDLGAFLGGGRRSLPWYSLFLLFLLERSQHCSAAVLMQQLNTESLLARKPKYVICAGSEGGSCSAPRWGDGAVAVMQPYFPCIWFPGVRERQCPTHGMVERNAVEFLQESSWRNGMAIDNLV